MKNNTSFTDEEIMGVLEKVESPCPHCSLTYRQILNIAERVDCFNGIFENKNDKLLALDFSSMIRAIVVYYLNHVVEPNKKINYRNKQYMTIDSAVKRVILTMYPKKEFGDEFKLYEIDDKNLEQKIDSILDDLRLELLERYQPNGTIKKLEKKKTNED